MNQHPSKAAVYMFRFMGIACFLTAAVCSRTLAARFDPNPPLGEAISQAIVVAQIRLVVLGVVAIVFGEVASRTKFGSYFARPAVTNLLLMIVTVVLPFVLVEIGVRPFVIRSEEKTTSLFLQDEDLGWRMRPGSEAFWGETSVTINERGLRGPVIPYERNDAKRILYLGDSVTFGFMLPKYEMAYPYVVEGLMESEGANIETVNTGIGGYSPWQQLVYLKSEGLKYDPDVVLIGFVLNDVTEKFHLVQFGGDGVGYQLQRSYYSFESRLRYTSATYALIHKLAARLRFGSDVREGAVAREVASVEDLARRPDSDIVRNAWDITLGNVRGIVETCRSNDIPAGLIVFPYTFQVENPSETNAPQKVLREFANEMDLPILDLLMPMANALNERGATYETFYIDDNHLSEEGSLAAAEFIVEWLGMAPGLRSALR